MTLTGLLFFLGCIGGSVIQSVSGFGFAIFCMTFFPLLLGSYNMAVAVSGLCAATMASFVAIRHRGHINIRLILPLLAGYYTAFPIGVRLTLVLPEKLLMRALGAVLILLSAYFMFLNDRLKIRPTILNGVLFGRMGGFGAGFCSIGGPPAVLFLLAASHGKEEYRASSQCYFALGNWYGAAVRWYNGLITIPVLTAWGAAVAALLIGVTIGGKIFSKINAATLRRLVYLIMAVSGVKMLF